jgi:tRNA 2-thiouridine synthesizing protein A
MDRPAADRVIDTSGTFCPMPIIEAARTVRAMAPAQVLLVIATDPGIETDMPAWCKATRHEYLGIEHEGGVFRAWVRKKAAAT